MSDDPSVTDLVTHAANGDQRAWDALAAAGRGSGAQERPGRRPPGGRRGAAAGGLPAGAGR
jgi:hypothetical protein